MAYLKYKELTKYFYFYKSIDITNLPKYVLDYVNTEEKIFDAYTTNRDKGIFTDKKIVLFDVKGLFSTKQIHIIPYTSISTMAILYHYTTASLLIYVDSGYPLTLKFTNLTAEDKTKLRVLYCKISDQIIRK